MKNRFDILGLGVTAPERAVHRQDLVVPVTHHDPRLCGRLAVHGKSHVEVEHRADLRERQVLTRRPDDRAA